MDRKQIIGILLIFVLFYIWTVMNAPSEAELQEMKARQDSIELAEKNALNEKTAETLREGVEDIIADENIPAIVQDTGQATAYLKEQFGPFANAAQGTEEEVVLENDDVKITFTTKGARITSVWLKKYSKIVENESYKEKKEPLYLLEDDKNIFDYQIPSHRVPSGQIRTSDLFFQPQISGNQLTMTAAGADGTAITQTYTLSREGYHLDYEVGFRGRDRFVSPEARSIELKWVNFLDKLEKNTQFERSYSTVYFKEIEEDPDYCNCRKSDVENLSDKRIKWVSHSNQFFNSSLIADNSFDGAVLETVILDENSEDLKEVRSNIDIPLAGGNNETINMEWYIGPNDFENLREMDLALEEIIPFGRSIFGSINRWAIRPLFNFLSTFISSKGLVILALTLLVKILLFPFMYKMLQSQSKMSALKPELAKMKEKYKDDAQKQQMESMKIYREYGVNPLGGCLPVVLQMPVWFALYRFFPASIEFRQASFLWANDLSSYDVFFRFPFEVPDFMAYGNHLSLFTILWAGTTLIYTYYNTRHMDMTNMNPAMKYMQYLMPIMFLFFFNNYASGLTLYLFYSNVINIAQTVGSKKLLFNEDKIREKLEINKQKPKKKSGFAQRFEEAMKEQQRIQAQKSRSGKK